MNTNTLRQLSLVPLGVLKSALIQNGIPLTNDKTEAINALVPLVDSGLISIDSVKANKATAVGAVIPDEVRKSITDAVSQSLNAVSEVNTLRDVISRTLDENLQTSTKLDRDLAELTFKINSKVDAIQRPVVDQNAISASIQSEVSKAFDSFRKVTPAERIVEIAQTVPALQLRLVRDVFADCQLSYEFGGERVDFGDLEVAVWGDPSAPALVSDYIFNPQHLHQALVALDNPLPDNVWLAGERGTGKTEFVTQLASRLGRRLFKVSFDEALERAEFIGGNTIENGNVVWKAGVITQAIQHTGAIVLLDEIGFARAQNLAVLHAVTEHSPHRALVIAETGVRFPVASHVAFFCADNSNGHGDATGNFAGVREQNTAFIDRFSYTLQFQYLPQADEIALITKRTNLSVDATEILVKFANVAREKARAGILTQPPSLRQLFAWARAIQKGIPIGIAFENAIINKFPADCESELRGVFSATIDVGNLKSFLTK